MPRQLTTTKTSHEEWTHIFSVSIVIIPTPLLCQMQANSSGAEFLSSISKFIKRTKMFTSFTKREIRHFQVVVVHWRQRNIQERMMHVQSCCFAFTWSYCFFLLSRRRFIFMILNFLLFTIHCDPLEKEFSQWKLNCSCWWHPKRFSTPR